MKNDRLDALAHCQRLDRFTRGNRKAFSIVRVPSENEERPGLHPSAPADRARTPTPPGDGTKSLASHGIHVTGRVDGQDVEAHR
ncbi:MAG: hypothetical protein R3F31_06820 [Verrucomicrobiales bacterium]